MQVISTRQAVVPTESCSWHDLHLKKNTQRRSGLILLEDGGTAQTATDQSNDVQQNLRTVQPVMICVPKLATAPCSKIKLQACPF